MRPAAVPVIVLDDKSGKIIMKLEGVKIETGEAAPALRWVVPGGGLGDFNGDGKPDLPALRWRIVPGGVSAGPAAPAADADKRIDELEQKLKGILNELEKLRRERKEGAPQGGAGAPAGAGAPVLNQVPYLERLLTNATDAAAMARAMAEKAAADRAAADEARKAAEDKIERLREEIRKLKEATGGNPPAPESK